MAEETVFDRLEAEYAAFDATLDGLDDDGWSGPTLCEGWDVRDLVCHLWLQAAIARQRAAGEESALDDLPGIESLNDWIDDSVKAFRHLDGPTVWGRWRQRREDVVGRLRSLPRDARVDWTVGPMGPAMLGTVLTMEAWAHHHDVRAPLGLPAEATPAVRDVAFLAHRTLPWAFELAGEEYAPVRFELDLPDGGRIELGDADATEVVRGDATELGLVAVQRLARDQATSLRAEGDAAATALRVMRCFPP